MMAKPGSGDVNYLMIETRVAKDFFRLMVSLKAKLALVAYLYW